ncbi:MAG: transposase zinc-binding domain-containing protein [Betaproteobacteria bacterium]|nr:transposase zinc-binding domain-containing protein [Betaproteobacteria bacterium]
MQADRPAIYRPRRPRASPLWQCVRRHLPELRASGRVRRAVENNVLERFLDCGDPHRGFARIRCGGCGHDLLLAFSCKTRYFCPSCHQKRVLAWARLIRKVCEVDPLECPKCGAQMRVIALIQDPAVIERILTWLGLWEPRQPGGPSPPTDGPSLPLTCHPVPDIA